MTVMITGTGTIIGNKIAEKLLKKKYNVYCVYNKNYPQNLERFKNSKLIKLDLAKKITKRFDIKILIHCASATPERYSKPYFNKINIDGFKNLLLSSKIENLKKIVLISSFSIYEKNKEKIISEKTKPRFKNEYAISKIGQENIIKNFCKRKNIKCIILRLSSILSKNCSVNFYCNALKNIKKNLSVKIIGHEKKTNSIFFVDDLANLTQLLIKKKQIKKINIYNVASTMPIKIIDIIKLIHKKFNKPFIVAVNKIDKQSKHEIMDLKKEIKYFSNITDKAYFILISAVENKNIKKLLYSIKNIASSIYKRFKASKLTEILESALNNHPPPMINNKRIRLKFAQQINSDSLSINIFGTKTDKLPASYEKYLMSYFIDKLKLKGIPLRIKLSKQKNPFND